MTRSSKKAYATISKRMDDNVYSVVRRTVKQTLNTIDVEEPDDNDLLIIDADARELGLEDWGTKFGLEFCDDEEWEETRTEMRRK